MENNLQIQECHVLEYYSETQSRLYMYCFYTYTLLTQYLEKLKQIFQCSVSYIRMLHVVLFLLILCWGK